MSEDQHPTYGQHLGGCRCKRQHRSQNRSNITQNRNDFAFLPSTKTDAPLPPRCLHWTSSSSTLSVAALCKAGGCSAWLGLKMIPPVLPLNESRRRSQAGCLPRGEGGGCEGFSFCDGSRCFEEHAALDDENCVEAEDRLHGLSGDGLSTSSLLPSLLSPRTSKLVTLLEISTWARPEHVCAWPERSSKDACAPGARAAQRSPAAHGRTPPNARASRCSPTHSP